MAQRTSGRVLAGIALVASLTLAGPTPAHAIPRLSADGVWSWVSRLWDGSSATLGTAVKRTSTTQSTGRARYIEKAGVCIDPNGCFNHQTMRPTFPGCAAQSDQGVCIDPNG